MTQEQRSALAAVVSVNQQIMHGTPCFAGTRVPVQTLLDYLEDGQTIEQFFADFPRVKREQVIGFLHLAKERLLECVSS
jgi:uncharacterized protein (DUF433 family)